MNDLMLRIRSEVLKSNIQRVRKRVENLNVREKHEEIEAVCAETLKKIRNMGNSLTELKRIFEDPYDEELVERVTMLEHDKDDVLLAFNRIQRTLNELLRRYTVPLRKEVETRPLTCEKQLEGIQKALDAREPNRQEAWQAYRTHCDEAGRILSEYIEFMGGLALRDIGFDEGICDLADELIPSYQLTGKKELPFGSLTIPARQQAVRMTWARIVRMGFPEWTIWALPLTAHDIWYVMAQDVLRAEKVIEVPDGEGVPVEEGWIQECLADAFAIWATGPAYAYAAFFLRFDPFHAYRSDAEHAADAIRAHAILKMWALMDKYGEYKLKRGELEEEWQESLRHAEPPLNTAEVDTMTQRVDTAITALAALLPNKMMNEFTTTAWMQISQWPEKLLNGEPIDESGELRWVLNAAWLARVKEPSRSSDIEKRARVLWDRVVMELKERPSAQGPGTYRRHAARGVR